MYGLKKHLTPIHLFLICYGRHVAINPWFAGMNVPAKEKTLVGDFNLYGRTYYEKQMANGDSVRHFFFSHDPTTNPRMNSWVGHIEWPPMDKSMGWQCVTTI